MHLQNYSMQKLFIPNKYSLPEEFLGKQYFLKKKLFLETYVFRGFPIMHLQNYLLQTNIHYKKKYCKKYIDGRKKNIAKNIHCKTIFIARRISWWKSIFLATCVNRGFPIICTCKNTEPTHRIALWVQETPRSTKSQKSVLKKPDMKYERPDIKFDLSYWSKQAPSEWDWTNSIGKSSIEFPNNICQSLVLFSYQYKLIEFSLKLYPYRKARGWIPLEDPIVRKEGIDEGCLSKFTRTHTFKCLLLHVRLQSLTILSNKKQRMFRFWEYPKNLHFQ